MNISQAPKKFCDNITIGFGDDYFVMGLLSGQAANVYALTAAHTKRLHQYLGKKLEEYEAQQGEIDAEWVEGVKSPIQMDAGFEQQGEDTEKKVEEGE